MSATKLAPAESQTMLNASVNTSQQPSVRTLRMESSPPLASMKILVIGAGMAGLATALALARQGFTDITLFELASQLAEVGAGINITPNLARLLDRFGVLEVAKEEGVPLEGATILKSKNDEVLSAVNFAYIEKEFAYPFIVVHRSALQRALVVGCERSGKVKFQLGTSVTDVDLENTRVRIRPTKEGTGAEEWVQGDVVFAGDGVKSAVRAQMLEKRGIQDEIEDTGQAAYRILLRREQVLDQPDLLPFFDGSISYRWIGYQRHVIAYPISSHSIFNVSTAHPDTNFAAAPTTSWTTRGSKERMLEIFSDFCPRVQRLLKLAPEGNVCEWKLRVHQPLPTWVDGRTALVGDACHPTLPHLAQGAAQAVEDAAVIAIALSKISSKEDIHKALLVYERLRKSRAEDCVARAADNGRELQLAEGDAQEERDMRFRNANKEGGSNPDKSVDKDTQALLFAHDCERDTHERWDTLWAEVCREDA